MCLERIPYSNETKEKFREHMTSVHSADCSLEILYEMCQEAEERQSKEGWGLNDIIQEEEEWREAEKKKRAEARGLIGLFRRKKKDRESRLEENVIDVMKCTLCKWTGNSKKIFQKHLEKDHKVIFGIKEMMEQNDDKEENCEEETYI